MILRNNDYDNNDKILEDKNNIDNEKLLDDEFYTTQLKYYDEIEEYIEKMKNDNINNLFFDNFNNVS